MFRKIDKTSTFNDVLKQIIENIQNGELQPGDALPAERILAEEFGISRPALREVLKALSLLGITVSVHGISKNASASKRFSSMMKIGAGAFDGALLCP